MFFLRFSHNFQPRNDWLGSTYCNAFILEVAYFRQSVARLSGCAGDWRRSICVFILICEKKTFECGAIFETDSTISRGISSKMICSLLLLPLLIGSFSLTGAAANNNLEKLKSELVKLDNSTFLEQISELFPSEQFEELKKAAQLELLANCSLSQQKLLEDARQRLTLDSAKNYASKLRELTETSCKSIEGRTLRD